MNKTEELLNKLKNVKGNTGRWTALCQAHPDKNLSLTVKTGNDGRILINCHAGCRTEHILIKIGFRMTDLFPDKKTSPTEKCQNYTFEKLTPGQRLEYEKVKSDELKQYDA